MYRSNNFYGQTALLREYCGVARPYPIPGYLQHGWTYFFPFHPVQRKTPWPKYLWSRRMMDIMRDERIPHGVPVGAPFLYLDHDRTDTAQPTSERRLLAIPLHGFEDLEIASVERAYEEYASSLEELARGNGFSDVTVCMYWFEHQNPLLRSVFTSRGFEVTTNGHRDDNESFLRRLSSLLTTHAFVTSNRACTALFYALYLGVPSFCYGPAMHFQEGLGVVAPRHRERVTFPELDFESFDGSARRQMAEEELGLEFKLAPEAMRELFGWSRTSLAIRLQRRVEYGIHWRSQAIGRRLRTFIGRPDTPTQV